MIDPKAWQNPEPDIVRYYIDAFNLVYQADDQRIIHAFRDSNIDQRVHLINAYYHTRVPREQMVKNIQRIKNLDILIKTGCSDAIVKIANCDDKQYFVFATKYCCFANREKYPIYDSLSIRTLKYVNEHGNKNAFYDEGVRLDRLKADGYEAYRNIVNGFRTQYGLERFNYKELDQFLWLAGKNMG